MKSCSKPKLLFKCGLNWSQESTHNDPWCPIRFFFPKFGYRCLCLQILIIVRKKLSVRQVRNPFQKKTTPLKRLKYGLINQSNTSLLNCSLYPQQSTFVIYLRIVNKYYHIFSCVITKRSLLPWVSCKERGMTSWWLTRMTLPLHCTSAMVASMLFFKSSGHNHLNCSRTSWTIKSTFLWSF